MHWVGMSTFVTAVWGGVRRTEPRVPFHIAGPSIMSAGSAYAALVLISRCNVCSTSVPTDFRSIPKSSSCMANEWLQVFEYVPVAVSPKKPTESVWLIEDWSWPFSDEVFGTWRRTALLISGATGVLCMGLLWLTWPRPSWRAVLTSPKACLY